MTSRFTSQITVPNVTLGTASVNAKSVNSLALINACNRIGVHVMLGDQEPSLKEKRVKELVKAITWTLTRLHERVGRDGMHGV